MKAIEIYEVGPRDGFQNQKVYIPKENKLLIIDAIAASGVKHIQVTSFVSPKAIPQMADSAEVAAACAEKYPENIQIEMFTDKSQAPKLINQLSNCLCDEQLSRLA